MHAIYAASKTGQLWKLPLEPLTWLTPIRFVFSPRQAPAAADEDSQTLIRGANSGRRW
jgi:hypothetical protein